MEDKMVIDLVTLTACHTAISIVALVTGAVAVFDLFESKVRQLWTVLFLVTAIATSATGFLFPFNGVLPSHILSLMALAVLAAMLYGLYGAHLSGAWRMIHAMGTVASLWFLVFVGIAQAFGKIAPLHSLAPTGTEAPFAVSQLVALVLFIVIGVGAVRSFHPAKSIRALA
jgi:hypothetical protein